MNQTNLQRNNISTRRTYLLLKGALFDLMTASPFERITLTDICGASLVPRSTFYRYFEDKYDLLHYCLRSLVDELGLTEEVVCFQNMDSIREFLRILISHVSANIHQYRKIYLVNRDGALMKIIRDGLLLILTEKLSSAEKKGCRLKVPYPIFTNMLADYYFSIIKCYLELAEDYEIETFIDSICLFTEKDFFETSR